MKTSELVDTKKVEADKIADLTEAAEQIIARQMANVKHCKKQLKNAKRHLNELLNMDVEDLVERFNR